tara:strand:- start:17155 stop:17742 length:588 start_codon:yes stop_codon:yes gene_type:complete
MSETDTTQKQNEEVGTLVVKDPEELIDSDLINKTFSQLPIREKTEEEKDFIRSNLDEKKKIVLMNNLIKFDDGSALRFRFDTRLLKKSDDDIRFCMAIYGAMRFDTPEDVKKHMLQYVHDDFDDDIEEIHMFRKGNADEHDTCIVLNPENDEQVLWIKFLRQKITDRMWKEVEESKAGKNSVLINQSIGRESPIS